MAKIGTVWVVLVSLMALGYGQRLIWLGDEGFGPFPRLSADGRVVVSDYDDRLTDRTHPVLWTYQDGWWYLKADGGLTRDPREALVGYANAVSYDGSIVTVREPLQDRLLLWKRGIGIEEIPRPAGTLNWAQFPGLSWDGNWLAGELDYPPRPGGIGPRRGTVRISPTRQAEFIIWCFCHDMSASGREIVGNCYFFGYHWREGEGLRFLPWEGLNAVSADGRVATGGRVRWLVDENRVEQLFEGSAYLVEATDISADGRVIVGYFEFEFGETEIFLWIEGRGFATLRDLYPSVFRHVDLGEMYPSMSADGRYILLLTSRNQSLKMAIFDRFGYQGDVDVNGCVDDGDLLRVLFAFGQTGSTLAEDVNYDYVVDEQDLLLVLEQFGQGCGG
ncbi:hypothetical protein HRbin15_00928 [bacterium HR15]|nr:hypothetical protein HRbin15_00928 [bacterium HR15]